MGKPIRKRTCGWVLAACLTLGLPVIAQAQPGNNPITEALRALNRAFRKTAEEIEQSQNGRDQLDIRPAQRPEDNRNVIRATELLSEQRWSDGVEVLQFLLDQPSDAFSFRAGQKFISLQNDIDRLLGELPPEARRVYETRYGPVADKLLEDAKSSQNEAQLIELANRFLHTNAGQSAMDLLMRQWMSRGDFGSAAAGLRRLLPLSTDAQKSEREKLLAVCLARQGDQPGATAAAASLDEATRQMLALIPRMGVEQPAAPLSPILPYDVSPDSQSANNPLPTPRWSVDLVERFAVNTSIRRLQADLRDGDKSLLPTNQPLVVGDMLALRTLRGLQVRNLRTGDLVWERRTAGSPEEKALESGEETVSPLRNRLQARLRPFGNIILDDDDLGEQHQLTSLMYRDSVFASLSSDGRRLFAVEEHGSASFAAPMLMWGERSDARQDAQWATNVLTAYDVVSGRIMWRVGGPAVEEEFSSRLAGTFFFGPPTPDNGELLAVGERNGEVQLISLSPHTGEELWSVALSVPGSPLSQDVVRRQWACQPVVAEDLILCPTTTSWFTAVHRHSHRLAWTTRYAPRSDITRRQRGQGSVQVLAGLNDRWQSLRPVVHNGYVLLTPPELPDETTLTQPMFFCVELATGKALWDYPKAEGLYLAGIADGHAVIVGNNSIDGVKVGPRMNLGWKISIRDQQRPSGRGLVLNNTLWLPLNGNKLVKYDLKKRVELESFPLQVPNLDLGNLTLANGELISLTYQWLAVFPTDLTRSRSDGNPLELARADLGQARQLLLSGKPAEADVQLTALIPKLPADPGIAAEQRELSWQTLTALAISDNAGKEDVLLRLRDLAMDDAQKRTAERLIADGFRKRGDAKAAALAYLKLLETWPLSEFVEEQTRQVRIDGWISGRMRMIMKSLPEAERKALDDSLREYVTTLPWKAQRQESLSRALASLSTGADLELELAEADLARGELANALIRLQRVRGSDFPQLQAEALARMGHVLEQHEWREDSLAIWKELRTLPLAILQNGENSRQLAGRRIFRLEAELQGAAEPAPVAGGEWIIEQSGTSMHVGAAKPVPVHQQSFAALEKLRIQFDEENDRLLIEDARTGKTLSSLPLRSQNHYGYGAETEAWRQGPLLLVVHGGVVNAIAWPDAKLLWTSAPDLHGWDANTGNETVLRMQRGSAGFRAFLEQNRMGGEGSRAALISATNAWGVVLGTRSWTVLDPLTGEEIWREPERPAGADAGALGEARLVTGLASTRTILRIQDGGIEQDAILKPLLADILFTPDGEIISATPAGPAGRDRVYNLARRSLLGETRWSVEIPGSMPVDRVGDEAIFWLTAKNAVQLVRIPGGEVIDFGELPVKIAGSQRKLVVLADSERYFVFINEDEDGYTHFNVDSQPFRGTIIAYDRAGKQLWTQSIAPNGRVMQGLFGRNISGEVPLNLVMEDFRYSPLLLLVGEHSMNQDGIYHSQMRIRAIDKQTGETRLDWKRPTESGGFMDMQVDLATGAIDLRTFESRLRLRQAVPPAGNGGAGP